MIAGTLVQSFLITLLLQTAPPAPAAAPAPEPAPQPGMYVGVVSCAGSGCHGSPAPVENATILMNEYDSWVHAPAPTHVRAFDVLLTPRSQRIAKNLRLAGAPEKAQICLDCHALNVPASKQAGVVELTDGVSCESCHGPASGWRSRHAEEGWTHQQSVDAGMIDLRDPATRARTCLQCHMGNEEKIVDHELIAAGHPVLMFELDNFTESRHTPPHWKLEPGDDSHGFRAWAVGQAVALEESARNTARLASSGRWPEFSQMSCSACHHALRDGSWRQERGYAREAGLPPWSSARWVALRHIVAAVDSSELAPLEADVDRLAGAVARMRDPESAAAAAREVAARMARLVPKIDRARWNEAKAEELMRRIASDPAITSHDRQDAEQATYALVSLSSRLVRANPSLADSTLVREVDALYRILDRTPWADEYDRAEFARALRGVREALR
jgi:hypothetical protein